jgi:hypothetical protein
MSLFNDYLDSLPKGTATDIAVTMLRLKSLDSVEKQREALDGIIATRPRDFLAQISYAVLLLVEEQRVNEQN